MKKDVKLEIMILIPVFLYPYYDMLDRNPPVHELEIADCAKSIKTVGRREL